VAAPRTRETPLTPSWWWFVVIAVAYAAAVTLSACYGTPQHLPGIALGLPVLLHLERAGAVTAVIAVVATVAYLTKLGHLPTQFGNVGYADIESRQKAGEDRQQEAEKATAEGLLAMRGGLEILEHWVERAIASVPELPPLEPGSGQDDGA
jgi:hypothetical protein